jgi:hypothetical protein
MNYDIEFNGREDRFFLIEDVGAEPCEWDCPVSLCWKDCVPCCFCDESIKVIPDKKAWEAWKKKYDNREKIPCSKADSNYFMNNRLSGKPFNKNHFAIVNGEAVQIQKKINF